MNINYSSTSAQQWKALHSFSYTKGRKYSILILFHMKENNKQIMHLKSKGQLLHFLYWDWIIWYFWTSWPLNVKIDTNLHALWAITCVDKNALVLICRCTCILHLLVFPSSCFSVICGIKRMKIFKLLLSFASNTAISCPCG